MTPISNYAENTVYQALLPLESQGYKIYHSVSFVDHFELKHDYEADFLICGPYGFMVLEVKGGNVKWDSTLGCVLSTNSVGESFRVDPWKQGMENGHKIREHFNFFFSSRTHKKSIAHTWAAIFPDGKINFKNKMSYSGHREVSFDMTHLANLPGHCIRVMTKSTRGDEDLVTEAEWDAFYTNCYTDSF